MLNFVRYGAQKNQTVFQSATPLDDDTIARYAPSIFADHAHDSRGQRYAFIPTSDVLAGLRREGFQVFEVRQTKCRDEGKRDFTKHLLRLRHPDAKLHSSQETGEIVLVNSHDGTSSYQIMEGVFRYICKNGLIMGEIGEHVKVRHTGNVVDDVIEGSFRVIDNLKQVEETIDDYKAIRLDRPEQLLLANAAQELRWEGGKAPVDADRLLTVRRPQDQNNDLWTTFNRVQENIVRGGLPGRTSTGKRTTTREVGGVNENVRLNKALSRLAEGMAALKRGERLPELETA
jgi:hypothetical protein